MDSANSTPLAQDGSSSGMASGQQDMSATTVKPKKKRIRRKTVRRTILDPNYKITTPAYSEQILSKDGDGKNPVKVEEAIIETFINADGTKTVKKTTKSKQFSPDEEGDGGDSGDAAEGSDTTDSPDSNDTNDSANTDDTSESPEGTDSGESTDSSEPADSGEPTESSESADSDESTESSESSDTTDDPGSSDSGVTESSSETDNSAATDTDEETVVGSSTTSTGLVIIKKKRKVTKVKVRKGGKKGMKGGMKGGPKGGTKGEMKRVQGRRGGRRMMNGRMGGRMRGRGGRRPNKVMVRFNAPEMSDMANSTTPVNETMANNATQTDMGSMAPGNNDSNQTENGETTTSGGQATTEQVVVTTETSMTTSTDSMSSPETAVETTTTTTIMTETSSPANGAKADPNGTVLKDETVTTSTGKKVHKRTIRRKKMKPGQNVTVSPDGAQSTTSSSISTKPSVPQAEEVQSLNIIELFTKVAK
ncbi:hypothetical protein HDE_05653 [Halotydeus destructor]|nr:hypothetical protein HDE_05653 [Halotydeus destructor]